MPEAWHVPRKRMFSNFDSAHADIPSRPSITALSLIANGWISLAYSLLSRLRLVMERRRCRLFHQIVIFRLCGLGFGWTGKESTKSLQLIGRLKPQSDADRAGVLAILRAPRPLDTAILFSPEDSGVSAMNTLSHDSVPPTV
jgi:hypothetical protein